MPAALTVVDKEPIAFRTNRMGHRYPLFGGVPDQAVGPRRKRWRQGELFPVPDYFAPALEQAVSDHWCSRENRKMLKVAVLGGSLVLEEPHWRWRRHCCECCSVNDFGLAYLTEKVLVLTADGIAGCDPVLAVVAASKRTGGGTASQIVAVVEVAEKLERHCLRLQISGAQGEGVVTRGCGIAAGTLMALGRNGSIKWCAATNTFEFHCQDDRVSPMELDLPQTWIAGSDIKI
jgi:hypothetical protein